MANNNFIRTVLLVATLYLGACSHPLEIQGMGTIVELNELERYCPIDDFWEGAPNCAQNLVFAQDYIVRYEAKPALGWTFLRWEGLPCDAASVPPYCEYNVPQSLVDQVASFPPFVVPATRAVFARAYPAREEQFRMNDVSGNLRSVEAVSLGGGQLVVCWSRQVGAANWKLICRLWGEDGSPLSMELPIADVTSSASSESPNPAVGALSDGSFVVVWDAYVGATGNNNIVARRFSNSGAPIGGEIAVNSLPAASMGGSSIAGLDDGSFVIAWQYFDSAPALPESGVYARHFSPAGIPSAPEFPVNVANGDLFEADAEPSILAVPGAGFYVAWTQKIAGQWSIVGREFSSNLTGMSEQVLNTTSTDQQDNPQLGKLGVSGIVVTWNQRQGSADEDLVGRLMPARVLAGSQEIIVAQGLENIAVEPFTIEGNARPAQLTTGQLIFAFDYLESSPTPLDDGHGYARMYTTSPAPVGEPFQTFEHTTAYVHDSNVLALADGSYMVIAATRRFMAGNANIWGRRLVDYELDGSPNFIDLDDDNDGYPDIVDSHAFDASDPGDPCPGIGPGITCDYHVHPWFWNVGFVDLIFEVSVPQGQVLSSAFTTDDSFVNGRITFGNFPGAINPYELKNAWISLTPNGPSLAPECEVVNSWFGDIQWALWDWDVCDLQQETEYFFNIENVDPLAPPSAAEREYHFSGP